MVDPQLEDARYPAQGQHRPNQPRGQVILMMLWTTITMATKTKATMTMDRSEIYCRFVLEYPKEVEEARALEEACIQQLISFDSVFITVFDSVLMIISKASPEKEDAILASTGVFHLMALLLSILPYFTSCDRCSRFTATICSFVISMKTTMTIDRDN